MEEYILSKEELIKMFKTKEIMDTGKGWFLKNNKEVTIVALHELEAKYIKDIANAKLYKIIVEGKM